MSNETKTPPIVQALRQINKIIYPLKAKIRFRGNKEVILTLPNYPAKTGELHVTHLGPGRGQRWRIEVTGEFEKFAKATKKAIKTIGSEGEMLS